MFNVIQKALISWDAWGMKRLKVTFVFENIFDLFFVLNYIFKNVVKIEFKKKSFFFNLNINIKKNLNNFKGLYEGKWCKMLLKNVKIYCRDFFF